MSDDVQNKKKKKFKRVCKERSKKTFPLYIPLIHTDKSPIFKPLKFATHLFF